MLATAGGLVFSGSADGYLYAFDARPARCAGSAADELRHHRRASTWKVGAKQYVGVWAGWGGATPIWGGDMAKDPAVSAIPLGGHLYVFAL